MEENKTSFPQSNLEKESVILVDTKICPFCGETIRLNARKCRFCGEWLGEELIPKPEASIANTPSNIPTAHAETIQPQSVGNANPNGNIVVHVHNVTNVEQNQTTIIEEDDEDIEDEEETTESSGSNWILLEIWGLSAGYSYTVHSWGMFFGLGIVLSIIYFIPFLGAILCYLLGLAWGLLAGGFFAGLINTTVGWIAGILVTIFAISAHLEARKRHMKK